MDLEQYPSTKAQYLSKSVQTLAWSEVAVTVRDKRGGARKTLIDSLEGVVRAGECCAVMGPSGCGKTTFLNALAQRPIKATRVDGTVLVNGVKLPTSAFRQITSFVEEHDTFIGALTVRETLQFASRLAGVAHVDRAHARISDLLESFGLTDQSESLVGKGLSSGQKRRLTVAKQLITDPDVLFLDEPTSGLDSVGSYQVISHLRQLAKKTGLIVILSIHQPSTSIFNLFDRLLLLSGGKTHYFGPVSELIHYYASLGVNIPERTNPADFLLELVSTDFLQEHASIRSERERVAELAICWNSSASFQENHDFVEATRGASNLVLHTNRNSSRLGRLIVLFHRTFLKAYRDGLAYGYRLAMYTALGVLAGTIWLHMDNEQDSIQLLVNSLLVSCGFMSFMAVTYVPAFMEDYRQFRLDRRNGLYSAGSLLTSNFLVSAPYLFAFSFAFSIIFYWLGNCRHSAGAFFTWIMWLFLNLLAAEGVVILAVSIFPNFVGALVVTALLNVIAFATGGTLVAPSQLNAFYKYGFYYWNYQSYVFQGLMITQFDNQKYECGAGCQCRYTPLPGQCSITGTTILSQYGVNIQQQGRNIGIVVAIMIGYRVAAWGVLQLRR